ncbi:uncharacterized protein LOC120624469 isoform X2 [Pararge aegeria]|uniref:uncharacterized protein LOC120624469 isoform X2 n=1 Tax=Pararge aegeria TaxID=116150 RepID=UPI0019CFBC84|nr:uncharacterized protein LOC120624469 isoform X2 [Pararge aegeria]
MLLNNLMEGESVTTKTLISSIKKFNTDEKEHGTIKALLKNFILPDTDMAIKQKQSLSDKCVYSVPIKPSISPSSARKQTINEAKQAFLNATVDSTISHAKEPMKEPILHYAQIATVTESDDTRSTGGGKESQLIHKIKTRSTTLPIDIPKNNKKMVEQQHRKVSFKIKNASAAYRRPPLISKTTMTITSSKVSELTKKFNNLMIDGSNGSVKQSKLVRTIESLQTVSRCSASNSSTPSSTLSSSPNIKIVLRHRKGSKRRGNRKRCSSVDSIDKSILSEGSVAKIRVIRSKSDGTKIPKSPKKRLKYQDSSEQPSGSDSVDGSPTKPKVIESPKQSSNHIQAETNAVKDVIKMFENEISAQAISTVIKKQNNQVSNIIPIKEKPKVPEKKSSLVLTKNLVLKDGVPKIRSIKSISSESNNNPNEHNISKEQDIPKKKEPMYEKKKFKTNYIHSEKLPLHLVEIIQEDANETSISNLAEHIPSEVVAPEQITVKSLEEENLYQDLDTQMTPNDSFLWRRKSTQISSENDKSTSESTYGFVTVIINENTITCSDYNSNKYPQLEQSHGEKVDESQDKSETPNIVVDQNSDFESNLIEACNKEVLIGYTSKAMSKTVIEDDYEPLEPRDTENVVVISVKSDRTSKINCPLPEIPKEVEKVKTNGENIYQCLLEMRSHPEGDESSLHNYELCGQLEERTRGDGDSDDGYEYCKSPIKPYCLTSSSGIQIAEHYNPYISSSNNKNYSISKSVSGTSTVSYEKIGTDRIYEKIPPRPPKSKDSSPNYNRHSFVSSDYTGYNDSENIYDTIKHGDRTSLSHCYESIPNSPSLVKMRNNLKKQLTSAVQKRLSFDNVSNISQSTLSSEQKTNSIYGQRSVISYNGQEIAFQVPSSETSVSDRSDRSDDWVDVSDEEKTEEKKIIIVRERSRKSPVSWSQKVRHQWQNSPKQSDNKECDSSDSGHFYESLEPAAPHLPLPPVPPIPLEDDFDSFDSDSDTDDHDKTLQPQSPPALPASRLPNPPIGGGPYTLTKIANAAQRKMRQIKRNLTKRYSVAMDGKPFTKSSGNQNGTYDVPKNHPKTKSPNIYANYEKPEIQHVYSNVNFNDTKNALNKAENPLAKMTGTFKEELKTVIGEKGGIKTGVMDRGVNKSGVEKTITKAAAEKGVNRSSLGEKRNSNGDVPPPLPDKPPPEKPTTPTSDTKSSGTLSRKAYFSFKSRFRRATSMAVDINSDVPSALKITNSTFYLTDSMDGDSGFSNCDNGATETLSPSNRRRDGTLRAWSESSPCLALERPTLPPPPPPIHTDLSAVNEELKRLLPTLSRKEKGARTRTSWYAECGADAAPAQTSTSSWYAEAGLYQAGNISSSSGASSGSHPASPLPHSLFTHEPLYQFYNAAKVESACRETGDSDSDAYEVGGGSIGSTSTTSSRPSAMALVAPRGPARTLWCEVPEVVNSSVLSSLAPAQKKLQEAKFELLTSEASYLNSLSVLEAHFISHPAFRDPHVLPREDWETLCSTILPVRKCSQLLMTELERCWQENILLHGICDIVQRHAQARFHAYVKYCENQPLMIKTLQRLRERPAFAAALKRLESHPACQSLSLHSFLMLPMQRITRLPLLLDAVLRNLSSEDHEYDGCMHALATLNDFVSQCNEGARNTERVEELWRVASDIHVPPALRHAPDLGPALSRRDRRPIRWLVRSGEMTQLLWKTDELKLTFGKKFHKVPLHLFLFNDHLVITKKKGEECYVAIDHCPRSLVEVCSSDAAAGAKHTLLLTLLENHEGRTVEMLMSCPTETDARRWAEALAPPAADAGETLYAGWDCPQVAALYAYAPTQPDELALAEGDIVNVTRKTSEGWYYGERTRDGEAGWFPGAYTAEIASPHVRARNLRQRYRLLALSATYLGQRRKPV